ncbi:MAG: hypothetical protein ABSH33_18325 [Steroidobacteraceae bacterium]
MPRYATLLIVLMFHLALIAALLMSSRTGGAPTLPAYAVELLYLPPPALPRVRAQNIAPRRLSGDVATMIAPPALESPSASMSPPPAPSSDGTGSGVDWTAEARRALHAFEIRSHQPSNNNSVSGAPGDDPWRRLTEHHAGDHVKTANGDWIVWIDASCYQVAGSGASAYALGAALPQTICDGQSGATGGKPAGQAPAGSDALPTRAPAVRGRPAN